MMQMVEKFLIIYDYSSPGYSNKEEVDKTWHAVSKEVNIDRLTYSKFWTIKIKYCYQQ
jgi:hypothetical protein